MMAGEERKVEGCLRWETGEKRRGKLQGRQKKGITVGGSERGEEATERWEVLKRKMRC